MLSGKLLQLVKSHSEEIAAAALHQIRTDPNLEKMSALSDDDLFESWNRLLARLERWLDPAQRNVLAFDLQEEAKIRFGQGIPLHEEIYVFHLLRNQVTAFTRGQSTNNDYLELYAEGELEHWLANFFDFIVYHRVRGYEIAFRDQLPV
jgi:hypothetical protein